MTYNTLQALPDFFVIIYSIARHTLNFYHILLYDSIYKPYFHCCSIINNGIIVTKNVYCIECTKGDSLISDGPLLHSVTASDSIPSSNLYRLVDSGREEWCTNSSNVKRGSYLQLNFAQPVTLRYMVVKGYMSLTGVSTSFVRRFALEVQDNLSQFATYETVSGDKLN